jgi:Tfp pilus assembly protein PilO
MELATASKLDPKKQAVQQLSNPYTQIVLLGVIIALLSFFIVGPKYRAVQSSGADADAISAQRQQVESEKENLAKLMAKLENSKQDIAVTDEALPLNGRVSGLYALLESLVKNSSMQLAEISAADGVTLVVAADKAESKGLKADRKLLTTKVSLSVVGDMQQLKNLLESIETNPRVMDVDSLNIAANEEGVRFKIELKAYAYEN